MPAARQPPAGCLFSGPALAVELCPENFFLTALHFEFNQVRCPFHQLILLTALYFSRLLHHLQFSHGQTEFFMRIL